jgi:hypothetical protein
LVFWKREIFLSKKKFGGKKINLAKTILPTKIIDTSKKMYLSHSGKWTQVAFSLSRSSTFTCTTPVKQYKFLPFPGAVQVNVLE